jgi:SAM-dependent methyltransferase
MDLLCPHCHALLERRPAQPPLQAVWTCAGCGASFEERDRVVQFLTENDPFYEGRFAGTEPALVPETRAGRLALKPRLAWGLDLHYQSLLSRFLPDGCARVLDVGCGGGHLALLTRHPREIVGVDLSKGSLRAAATLYSMAVQTPADHLPFPDASFDTVVSSNFLGHVPFGNKDAVLAEMIRVLRPGGRLLHQLETSSVGAIFQLIQNDPDYFHEYWIALDGHIGLELPTEALARFRRHGLEVLWARPQFSGFFLPQGEATKRFDNTFGRTHWRTRALLTLDRWLAPHRRGRIVADTALGLANTILRKLRPLDCGIGLCVALQKPDRAETHSS